MRHTARNVTLVWRRLRDPAFSLVQYRLVTDRQTNRQTDTRRQHTTR